MPTYEFLTHEQKKAAYAAAGMPLPSSQMTGASYAPITSQSMTPAPSLPYKTPEPPPIYPVANLGTDYFAPTEPEKQVQGITDQLQGLNQQLVGQSAYRAEQEQAQGIPALSQTQRDLTSRLNALKNEAAAIPLQLQQDALGRGITAGGLRPIETGALRNNAIQALSTASLLEASRGNLTMALDMVDRAVAQKYDPIREEIAAKTANLDLILKSPAYSLADKKRAEQQKVAQEAAAQKLEFEQAQFKAVQQIALEAAAMGADPMTLRQIQSSTDAVEAARIATQAGFGPQEDVDTQVVKLDNGSTLLIDSRTGEILQDYGGASVPSGTPVTTTDSSGNTLQYGTPEYLIARLQQTSGSKTKPVASEREQLGKFANVISLTESLMGSLSKTTNDPVIGYLKGLNPYDFDARAVNAQVTALVPSAARALYGEVGVLTDSDIERYLKTLPNIRSTEDQNKFIAAMTLKNAMRSYEQTLLNMANSSVNVSGFVDSYKAISDKVAQLESEIASGASDSGDDTFATEDTRGYFSTLWDSLLGR